MKLAKFISAVLCFAFLFTACGVKDDEMNSEPQSSSSQTTANQDSDNSSSSAVSYDVPSQSYGDYKEKPLYPSDKDFPATAEEVATLSTDKATYSISSVNSIPLDVNILIDNLAVRFDSFNALYQKVGDELIPAETPSGTISFNSMATYGGTGMNENVSYINFSKYKPLKAGTYVAKLSVPITKENGESKRYEVSCEFTLTE